MRISKTAIAVAALGFGSIIGCQTQQTTDEKTAQTFVPGPNDAELPVGCAPANKDPAVGWQTTGHPTYVKPGCEAMTTTAAVDVVPSDEQVAEGSEALPPLAEVPADTRNPDIVEGRGGTPCGLTVISLSSGAVGDPCMTTEGVIEALGLSDQQRDRALAGVSDARTSFGETAVAH